MYYVVVRNNVRIFNIRTFSQYFFLCAAAVVFGCCFLTGAAITQKTISHEQK